MMLRKRCFDGKFSREFSIKTLVLLDKTSDFTLKKRCLGDVKDLKRQAK